MKAFETWWGRLQALGVAAAAIALVSVATVTARQQPPGRERGMRAPIPLQQLNLSADQKARIEAIFDRHREADQATLQEVRTARESLRKAIYGSATPDGAQIEQLTTQVAALEAKLLRSRIATEVEVATVLTDEQREQMSSMPPPPARRGPRE